MIGIYKKPNDEKSEKVFKNLKEEFEKQSLEYKEVDKNFDEKLSLLVVVGGDGTVLSVASRASEYSVPVLAINAGHVGFLSAFEASDIGECVRYIKTEKPEYEKRSMLKAEYDGKIGYALNEISVQRENTKGGYGCALEVTLKIDDELCDSFRGDGIIIASPTGSTAYSLSAGGAVLSPELNAFIATPVCSHSLTSKPVVFSDERNANISLSQKASGSIYCDGKFFCTAECKNVLTVTKSSKYFLLVKRRSGFFKTLHAKLSGQLNG